MEGEETIPDPPHVAREPAPHTTVPEEARQAMADPSRILNQYVLVVQVGEGAMGAVWKAWDTKLERWVAVKILHTTQEECVRRFRREAQLAARLRHPNICVVFEVGEAQGHPFLAMDFIEGTSIGQAMMSIRQVLDAMVKVCRAIDYAHKASIVHRDLKPHNIMISKEGEPFVTDFGLAKVLATESSLSVDGAILGTPAFMSPEQALGKIQATDERSDIYSLGATLYMLVTGRLPFEGESATELLFKVTSSDVVAPCKVNALVPPAVEAIVLKAMEKDKRRRYGSAEEMAQDLQRYLNDQPVVARPARKRILPIGISLAALAILAGALVLVYPRLRRGAKPAPTDWAGKAEILKQRLSFRDFKGLSESEIAETRQALAELPNPTAEYVAAWLESEVMRADRSEVRQMVEWCSTVRRVLPRNATFQPLEERLMAVRTALEPVVSPRPSTSEEEVTGLDLTRVKMRTYWKEVWSLARAWQSDAKLVQVIGSQVKPDGTVEASNYGNYDAAWKYSFYSPESARRFGVWIRENKIFTVPDDGSFDTKLALPVDLLDSDQIWAAVRRLGCKKPAEIFVRVEEGEPRYRVEFTSANGEGTVSRHLDAVTGELFD